ncbi:MAG: recombinase family protein [Actinobacteria bacterium]|nr:recombinase family protein [Actinomycetota bacterium]
MNCVIYLRVSTKEQAQRADSNEGYSIPAQREACVKYIEEKGWKLIDEYTDRGESARSKDRPQLQEMLSRIKKEKDVQVVVVHKIDRLARNMEDHITIKAILKRAGTVLESVMENIEDSASGNLVEGIHALMAEFYSANLATEVKKGMAEKAKRGGWPFKAPVGYKNERKGFRKNSISKIVVDPETAPHIKEAFQLYGTGNYSTHDIREFLVQRGVTNRRGGNNPMALSSVNALLLNPIYIGLIPWKGVNYPGNHEALIDEDTFEKVQEVMNVHNVAGERTRKHPHYLKGTLYCGECGSRMSVDVAKKKYVYFYCVGQKKKFTKCKELYVNTVDIEYRE